MRFLRPLLLLLVLGGCATFAALEYDKRFGPADPTRFDAPRPPHGDLTFRGDVEPILNRRCVVCHGCYDAPCQLKLGAWEGVARGASQASVYDSARLREAPPTRLFVDAQRASQWREKDFFPVLNERDETPENNLAASLLYQTLQLKREHPMPSGALVPASLDVSPSRTNACPAPDRYAEYAAGNPQAGMPFGLPGLDSAELATLTRWLAVGAPYEGDRPVSAANQRAVHEWETFLNGDSIKERLMSRYLYEHLFLGHLYFAGDRERRAFRLVRSATPPGQPVKIIATRRPYDDPGVARPYYRLVPEGEALLAKTHMPYVLDAARMNKYRRWFVEANFRVDILPGYAATEASNPFLTFAAMPVESRYRFLLDEAQFFIMNFIKGPVCRGQVAVDVIEDRFWVFFVDPARGIGAAQTEAIAREAAQIELPASRGSSSLDFAAWRVFADGERRFLRAKSDYLNRGGPTELGQIWDGDGTNDNAALTIFRHYDSASVVKGLVGEPPKTAWVIGYPLFERIFYLLVAGYDVFGNVTHQLDTRLYMDFMRMEGEFNFLTFLPRASREPVATYWYRDAPGEVSEYVYGENANFRHDSAVPYRTNDPQKELYGLLRERLAPVLSKKLDLATVRDAVLRRDLEALADVRGAVLANFPEYSVLRVDDPPHPPQYFSLMRNTAHLNVAHLMRESAELVPAENTLTVTPGFVGAYPNAIYAVPRRDLPAFAAGVRSLKAEADYRRFGDRFAVRRTDPAFWRTSDAMIDAYTAWAPAEAGVFDYNRLENR